MTHAFGSIRAERPTGSRHWRCSKRRPTLDLDGVRYCMDCGRPIQERYKITAKKFGTTYIRTHEALWGFWGAC